MYVNILEEVTYFCLIDANSNILCISHVAGSDTYLTQTQAKIFHSNSWGVGNHFRLESPDTSNPSDLQQYFSNHATL